MVDWLNLPNYLQAKIMNYDEQYVIHLVAFELNK